MTTEVYTIGYGGRTPAQLLGILEELDAVLFDIRFSPASMNPQWSRKQLSQVLGPRYVHVQALGNANYRNGGEIKLVDFDLGRKTIDASVRPVVLMCACRDFRTCHRSTVLGALTMLGYTTREIGLQKQKEAAIVVPDVPDAPTQGTLL
jgi:uncharacterized protein (DUF488 family)